MIAIVDPRTREVVDIIDESGSGWRRQGDLAQRPRHDRANSAIC
jgi:hypothetical protein